MVERFCGKGPKGFWTNQARLVQTIDATVYTRLKIMGRKAKYSSPAEKQAAYRNRQRVTICPLCESENVIPVSEDMARRFGVYCTCLCFRCNGLISEAGVVWQFAAAPGLNLPKWIALVEP